jgi:GNAT superfamily N-acetyltransferase
MRILDEAMDQCLLCIGYDFAQDSPSQREVARNRYQPGVQEKEWWRYQHIHLGLRTLVAYEGRQAVGHIEFIPIEHAPRPIGGKNLVFIDCLYVAPHARRRGLGRALLEAAEAIARQRADGMAVLTNWSDPTMPSRFFCHHGYHPVAARGDQMLLNKPFRRAYSPHFLRMRYDPLARTDRIALDFFHCPQCPFSGLVLKQLAPWAARRPDVDLQVRETGERSQVEDWGIAHAIFVDGRPVPGFPPDLAGVHHALESARASRLA